MRLKAVLALLLFVCPAFTPIFASPTVLAAQTKNETVYITRTGKKYHRDGCRSLNRSRIPIKRSDAAAQGYGACKVCRP